jgi:hypothetical protein
MTSLWKFNSVLPYFGLDERGFAEVLEATGAFVAGGSCLAAFLGTPIQEGQDMDIWLPEYVDSAFLAIRFYLESRGYQKETPNEIWNRLREAKRKGEDVEYTSMEPFKTIINSIHNFYKTDKNGNQIKIQLIKCGDVGIIDILNHFDLNICKFYTKVSLMNGSPTISITHPDLANRPKRLLEIHGRIMRPVPNSTYCKGSKNTVLRIKKYEGRGFRLETDENKEYI